MPLASAEKEARVISGAKGSRNPRGEFTTELRSVVILLGGAGDQSLRSGALLEAPLRIIPYWHDCSSGDSPLLLERGGTPITLALICSQMGEDKISRSVGHFGSRPSGLASDPTTTQPGSQSALANMSDG